MFSRDEMQRAIEDALKSMEGVALELYRRGREEAREELEEARARNADMRAMLEQVTRERDEARADAERYLADLRRCASEPYERTRELEALQAEVERLRETNDYLRTWLSSEELEGLRVKAAEHPLLWEEIHHLKDEVERLREMAHDFEAMREDRDEARAEVERVRKHYAASVLEHGKMLVEAVDSAKRQKSLADRAHDQACRLAAKLDARSTDQFRRGAEAMREAAMGAAWHSSAMALHKKIKDLPIPEEP